MCIRVPLIVSHRELPTLLIRSDYNTGDNIPYSF